MNVLVALEHRFSRLPDGSVWTNTLFARSFFERYLAVFTSVSVVARAAEVDSVPSTAKRVDGNGITLLPISCYIGPWEYLRKARQVRNDIAAAAKHEGAVILRASSQIGNRLEPHLRSTGRPYGLEVVGDPYDAFSMGGVRHPLRPFFRWWFPRILRRQCAHASATAYVTAYALQRRYPPAPGSFTTHYSSVELEPHAFASAPRPAPPRGRPFRILMVGALDQLHKAPDVLIQAFARCRRKGLDAELNLLGGGRQTPMLQSLTRELGVEDRVRFLGSVSAGDAVREQLDTADLFVLPSRTEGLPRAMIEAMARALPCVGTAVAGVPELIEADYLVPPNDPHSLADKILWLAMHPSQMEAASARNLGKAHEYSEEILAKRRLAFYRHVRQATAEWLKMGKRRSFRARSIPAITGVSSTEDPLSGCTPGGG
jgi:glycosyltransferase involved in cell wall biosynthesis